MSSKLIKYGLGISVLCIGGTIWAEKGIQKKLRDADFYKNSVVLLQQYEPAAEIFGRPILSGRLTLGRDTEHFVNPLSAEICIPIKGSKESGSLYVKASRELESSGWTIDQLDLEVSSSKQRWKFYDNKLCSSTFSSSEKNEDLSSNTSSNSEKKHDSSNAHES